MRPIPFILVLTPPLSFSYASSLQYTPFSVPYSAFDPSLDAQSPNEIDLALFRRKDGNCSKGKSCAYLGDDNACCDKKSFCAIDEGGHVACCPMNAHCVGAIGEGGSGPTPTAGSGALPTTGGPVRAGITGSSDGTVQNPYFPYAYLPTNFPNAAVCTSSFHGCQSQYASCTNSLAGNNAPGVTVDGGGVGGVTRAGEQGQMALAQATSVCSSLSVEACHSLTLPSCQQFGGPAGVGKGAQQSFSVDSDKTADNGGSAKVVGCLGFGVAIFVGVILGC